MCYYLDMKKETKIKVANLINQIESYFKNDTTGHSVGHLIRTMLIAEKLQKKEGGDLEVVIFSALLHDVHRIMQAEKGKYVSPKESLPQVKKFLKELDLPFEKKKHILYSIEHHEEYSFGKEKVSVTDIESKILQDADNLDAIGAIGLYRCFEYSNSHKIVCYVNQPLYYDDFEEKKFDISMVHHIHNKLCRLKDGMNTETGKKMAISRTKILDKFVNDYIAERKPEFEFWEELK